MSASMSPVSGNGLRLYAAPLLDREGTAIGIAGQMVDVTERVQIEAQLAQAQKWVPSASWRAGSPTTSTTR
jgi:hypothetical protein